MAAAREAALKCLYDVEQNGAYLNAALARAQSEGKLDRRDGALCGEIAYGVERNRLFLDNIIEHLSSVKLKKISPWIMNILRMGIYSIFFLDRIPISATVNECVRLARRYGHGGSAGFVNAILRRSAQKEAFLPDDVDSHEYLGIKYSCPDWLIDKWEGEGFDAKALCKAQNEIPPTFVRLNTFKTSAVPEICEKTAFLDETLILKGDGKALFDDGIITPQDAAAQMASAVLAPKSGERVLDLCAAPGGKSTHLAQIMQSGEVVACDIHEHKLPLIEANAKRMGADKIIKAVLNDACVFRKEFENEFDRVLCDVPCSGLGIIRRRPDIKWRKDAQEIANLADIQLNILKNATKYVKRGGVIVYSTCTISRAENEENIARFLSENSGFSLLPFAAANIKSDGEIQLLPHVHGTDGFYIAKLIRNN